MNNRRASDDVPRDLPTMVTQEIFAEGTLGVKSRFGCHALWTRDSNKWVQ